MSNEAIVNKRPAGAQNRSKIRTLAQVAMLGAVATVLMMIEFPIPVIAPPFYQMDFSEVPVLVGAFAMGRQRYYDRAFKSTAVCSHPRFCHSGCGRDSQFPDRMLLHCPGSIFL